MIVTDPPKVRIGLLFWSVATFGIVGLLMLVLLYYNLWHEGARNEELMIPFVFGAGLVAIIAGLMVWQLARIVSIFSQSSRQITTERPSIREVQGMPPAKLIVPPESRVDFGDRPSVVEHTTRQYPGAHKEQLGRE